MVGFHFLMFHAVDWITCSVLQAVCQELQPACTPLHTGPTAGHWDKCLQQVLIIEYLQIIICHQLLLSLNPEAMSSVAADVDGIKRHAEENIKSHHLHHVAQC